MNFRIYLYLILFLWHQIAAGQIAEEYTEGEKDEIELFRQLFVRLNTIVKSNIELKGEMFEVKEELKSLKEKCGRSESTATVSHDLVPPVCSFSDNTDSNNIDSSSFHCFGDDWVIIQRRIDGSENFDRTWNDYRNGFGNTSHEFFIGLEKLYAMTLIKPHELLIVLKDFDDDLRYAKYDHFEIGGENALYRLKELGRYSGTAGDSLSYHKDGTFSTKDRDNDEHQGINCAQKFGGGWWFRACHESNLNGHYQHSNHDRSYASGIHWKSFRAHWYSLKFAQVMVRPKK